jgi:hypothetical protein
VWRREASCLRYERAREYSRLKTLIADKNAMKESRVDHQISRTVPGRLAVRLVAVAALTFLLGTKDAKSAEPDLQLWFPVQFINPVGEDWSVSMQTELRLRDDISEFSQLVYKPALNYHFNSTWAVSVGYKYIDKYHQANEQDIWQESHFNKTFDDLVTGFQVRLEERFIDDMDGVIPRLRFLEHLSHPIGDSPYYLTGFGAVRFNLDDKGSGPVAGFEQSRIYAGLGRHIGERIQFEVGYLWRYEEERSGDDLNDHAIRLRMVFNTKAKRIKKPHPRDQYR